MRRSFILWGALFAVLLGGCTTKETKNYITNNTGPADWQPPLLAWNALPDAEVRGTVGLDVSATDSSAIPFVKLYVDGAQRDSLTAAPYRFSLRTDSLLDGVHLCEARAWDQYGNLGISPVLRVNVMNSVAEGPRVLWVPNSFATIQGAINASEDYDTIRVRDGTYYETLNTFGKGIWVESEHGPLHCTVNALGARSAFFVQGIRDVATIRGFRMTGGYYEVFLWDGFRANLFNNIFVSDTGNSLVLTGDGGAQVWNNLFDGSMYGIQASNVWGVMSNNIIQNASHFAFWNASLDRNPLAYGYNLFWDNVNDYAGFDPRTGDVHANPLLDLVNGRLLSGSPAIDSGDPAVQDNDGTRSDIGPFGGPYAY